MALNLPMILAYMANQKSAPVEAAAANLSKSAFDTGQEQLAWGKAQGDQLIADARGRQGWGTSAADMLVPVGQAQYNLANEAAGALIPAGREQYNIANARANELVGSGQTQYSASLASAAEAQRRGGQQWQTYLSQYVPVELQGVIDSIAGVYADDNTFNSLAQQFAGQIQDPGQRAQTLQTLRTMRGAQTAGAEAAAGKAGGQVGAAYGARENEMRRALGARGVSRERLAALSMASNIQRAAEQSNAMNEARTGTLRQGVEDRRQQAAYGRNFVNSAANFANQGEDFRRSGYGMLSDAYRTGGALHESGMNTLRGTIMDAARLRESGTNALRGTTMDAARLRDAASSDVMNATQLASQIRTTPQSWYGTSLAGMGTQMGAAQFGQNALNTAVEQNFQEGQARRAQSAGLWGGLGQLAGIGLGATLGGPIGGAIAGSLGSSAGGGGGGYYYPSSSLSYGYPDTTWLGNINSSPDLKRHKRPWSGGLAAVGGEYGGPERVERIPKKDRDMAVRRGLSFTEQKASPIPKKLRRVDVRVRRIGPAAAALDGMPVSSYRYKEGVSDGGAMRHIGPMADDVAREIGGNGQTVNIGELAGVSEQALREISSRVASLGGGMVEIGGDGRPMQDRIGMMMGAIRELASKVASLEMGDGGLRENYLLPAGEMP